MKQNSKMPVRNPPEERVTRERMKGGTTKLGGEGFAPSQTQIFPPLFPPLKCQFLKQLLIMSPASHVLKKGDRRRVATEVVLPLDF